MALSTLRDRVLANIQQQAPATSGRPAPASLTGEVPSPAAPATLEEAADGDPVQDSADAVMGWLSRYEGHVTDALPRGMDPGPFLAAVRAVLPKLRSCNPASVLQATITAARFGLVPDGRESVITAEFGRAVFIPTYRGYIALMHRSGQVGSVRVGMVYENDEYSVEPSAPSPLDFTHRQDPARTDAERGRPLFAYAFAWFTSGHRSQVVTVNREQAEAIRDEHSRAYLEAEVSGRQDSFWHTDFDAMWWKTAARQLEKVVPVSAEVRSLVEADRAGEDGRVQVLHAPAPEDVTPEDAALEAEADQAGEAAEASQDQAPAHLPRKRAKRVQPKRTTRAGRKALAGRRS
ncbi:RecT-like ssDNA binding protein [Streptomyces phage TurkishDelight]|uniref:RecT-like ssDNA binding protein n=1 Tax=Streptomyces phage TurkishDelight TaxID=2793708 RepID=A0A7T0Q3F4_9CAUD|nr:RecT-like ssDNA binding protein [Streptomyces phage TurkishDelight]QPL14089.1 RecT-like ssDNA binding protein [Streptomyces phage TurkishDelight]